MKKNDLSREKKIKAIGVTVRESNNLPIEGGAFTKNYEKEEKNNFIFENTTLVINPKIAKKVKQISGENINKTIRSYATMPIISNTFDDGNDDGLEDVKQLLFVAAKDYEIDDKRVVNKLCSYLEDKEKTE